MSYEGFRSFSPKRVIELSFVQVQAKGAQNTKASVIRNKPMKRTD